jgi:ribosome biogenesis GTPase
MHTARVIEVHRTNFILRSVEGECTATVRGSFHEEGEFPKVGDYVSYTILEDGQAVIEEVHPRSSVIKRKAASSDEEQTMVANVNLIFIVMGLDGDYNLSRLERYLVMAQQSDIPAVIVLNKTDAVDDVVHKLQAVEAVAGATPVLAVSALLGEGMLAVKECFTDSTTAVLLGSSGAGKSTITNWLLEESTQSVKETRASDGRGRHTTTSRQLFELPFGGSLIDTPGMRELGIAEEEQSAQKTLWQKIDSLAQECQFRNCDHEKSAGCAVLAALEAGELSEREYQNYLKMLREQEFMSSKDGNNAKRYQAQNLKRAEQKSAALQRKRLSSGG